MNKAKRVLENMDLNKKQNVCTALGNIADHADLGEQAQYINELLNFAETNEIPMQETMRKCGGDCLAKDAVELAKNIYENSSTIDTFLSGMNEMGLGGGNLRIENKKILAAPASVYRNIW